MDQQTQWLIIGVLVAALAWAHYFFVDRRNTKIISAYVDMEWSTLWHGFTVQGVEKTMNEYFQDVESRSFDDGYKVIMSFLAKRFKVPIKYDKSTSMVTGSTKLAIIESIKANSRDRLLNHWKREIKELEEHLQDSILSSFDKDAKQRIARYEKLIEAYDDGQNEQGAETIV